MPPPRMFVATTLLYSLVLACLCLGAGLLADRACGGWLPAVLLAPVGAALLIAVSQLATLGSFSAPATPWLLLAVGLGGVLAGRERAAALPGAVRRRPAPLVAGLVVYLVAMAPVLLAGRTTFTFGLSDPAVHMLGADYLLHHGQSYGGLDLSNSYGLFVKNYYGTSYPSGADTLFGASALLLGLPLIWTLEPFAAFALALACGPAWLLARRLGLRGWWAGAAAATMLLPSLVYAYVLQGAVKEIVTLPLLLACGCLVAEPRAWVPRGPRAAVPLALLFAGGISALGIAFGAWAVASLLALAAVLAAAGLRPPRTWAALAAGAATLAVAALPTWRHLGGAVQVAGSIATTSNPGNLRAPLRAWQLLGVWLDGSYKLEPGGLGGTLTHVLGAIVLAAAVLGAIACLRPRARPAGTWIALILATWLAVSHWVTTWADAKTLVLTAPVVIALAWAGIWLVRERLPRVLGPAAAALVALALAGGALASDELQDNSVTLATTARYEELATIDRTFAGRGPALFADFDEFALYALRDLDIGSPNFVFSSPALDSAAGGYGRPFALDSIAPATLARYPLIVTRRDPSAPRPPAAYALAWHGAYYLVWHRGAHARLPVLRRTLGGFDRSGRCAVLATAARRAGAGGSLAAALAPRVVEVALKRSRRPRSWRDVRGSITMKRPGTLRASFSVPSAGWWELSLRGRLMPPIGVDVDGRRVGAIADQTGGNSLITGLAPPLRLRLGAGAHTLLLRRSPPTLAPGERASSVLTGVLLSPAAEPPGGRLAARAASAWPRLCRQPLQWVEAFQRG